MLSDGANGDGSLIRVDQDSLKLEGYLGAFRIELRSAGKRVELEADMVLDFSPEPLIPAGLPPPGYIHCRPDETAITSQLLHSLEELTGTFDKPEFFRYDPDRCAHARNGVTACTRCIDACPAQAIHSLLERVEVDPYLCQGGGVCATVCPSGAISYAYPRSGDLGRRMRRLLQAFREAGGEAPVLLYLCWREPCPKRVSVNRRRCCPSRSRRLPASALKAGSRRLPGVRTRWYLSWIRV